MIDCHHHIIPSFDDGARDPSVTLKMCRIAVEDGVRGIIATPHHRNGLYNSKPEVVREKVAKLNKSIGKIGLDLTIYPGCEAHISPHLAESVEAGETLTLNDGCYLLLELPPQEMPLGVEQLVFDLQMRGIYPILAHPERIGSVQRDPDSILPLVHAGVLMQLTALSLTGGFGHEAQECAETLVTRRMAHIIASDAHSFRHRTPKMSMAMEAAAILLEDEDEARRMVDDVPSMVLRGEPYDPPPPVEAPPQKRSFFSFLWGR
ncbi:tyrosine-protein phosphatase [Oceanidesulfovibrio marinus]|nr:CpsB/CapC family capsule biosynthesis tyrosine phosphatase [Oceanidesulfovibrio marinus]